MSDQQRFTAQREALDSTVDRAGPTADRYHSALERYLAAVGEAPADATPARRRRQWPWAENSVDGVMTENVIVIDEHASFKKIVDTLAHNRVSALPVVDAAGPVLGVVSESDLLAKVAAGGDPRARIGDGHAERKQARRKAGAETAAELMTAPAITVTPDVSVVEAARVAAHARVRRLPVVDDENHVIGIVTRTDLLRVFLRGDEEIERYIADVLIPRRLVLNPQRIEVIVADGVVTLHGELERKRLIAPLLETVRGIAGVVAVHDHLTYEFDDTLIPPPRVPLY